MPTTHGGSGRVRPGVIDAAAIHAYTHGQCYGLAKTLAQRTGWEVTLLMDDVGDWTQDVVHALVRRPAGMYVDINGARTADSVFADFPEDAGYDYHQVPSYLTGSSAVQPELEAGGFVVG